MDKGQFAAIWLTPHVQQWLEQPTTVSLLHLFDQAINLVDADGTIISIVQPSIGAGPFSIVVAEERPFPSFISPQAHMQKTEQTLSIGSWRINLRPAQLWQPRPPWEQLRQQQSMWRTFLPEMQTAVTQNQERLTVGSPTHFAAQFQSATERIRKALAQNEMAELATAVTQLAGLGPGFTPAGDDFLLGLLLGLWATRSEAEVAEVAKIVTETAVPHTTHLSAAWLKAAAQGEAWHAWHDFLEGLLTGDNWQQPCNRILSNGATSGIASLMGFVAVVSLSNKLARH